MCWRALQGGTGTASATRGTAPAPAFPPAAGSRGAGDTVTAALTLGTEKHLGQPFPGPAGRSAVIARALRDGSGTSPRSSRIPAHGARAGLGHLWQLIARGLQQHCGSSVPVLQLRAHHDDISFFIRFCFLLKKSSLGNTPPLCDLTTVVRYHCQRTNERHVCCYVLLSLIMVSLNQINLATVVKIVQCVAP